MKAVVGSGILETCHRVFISSKVSMNAPWALLAATQGRIKRQIMPWPKTFAARSRFLICPMQSCRTRNGNVFPWQWKPMRLTQHPAMLARVQSWLKTKNSRQLYFSYDAIDEAQLRIRASYSKLLRHLSTLTMTFNLSFATLCIFFL